MGRYSSEPRKLWNGKYKPYHILKHLDDYKIICTNCDYNMVRRGFNFKKGLPVYTCPKCRLRLLYEEKE